MDDEEVEEGIMENATKCPGCKGMTGHEVLRERRRGTGVDFLLKCEECDKVHTIEFRTPPPKVIPFMLTDGPQSSVVKLELDLDEVITEGDVFEHEEMQWMVTRIDDLEDKPRRKRGVDRINRITAIRSDLVRVKVTMTIGEDSEASIILVPGDKEFVAGGIIKHEGEKWRIRALHSGTGRTLSGKMMAREIKRMYLHEPPSEVVFEPRTEQERRRAWQEGRLGFNPSPIKPPNERAGEKKSR
jgi:uncharacterized Zn finger protein